ncbi:MAG: MarC family protein [Nitrospirota bacterium]
MQEAAFFIYAFTSIFVIVNPVSALLTFVSLTGEMSEEERKDVAKRAVFVAFMTAAVFAVSGELILRLFGITADSLRVAGGAFLFIVAVDMVHARIPRESVTPEEIRDAAGRKEIAVFPIAIPMLTGPGAITTVIVLIRSGETLALKAMTMLAIVVTFVIAYLLFRSAAKVKRVLGVTASLVISRIMGLLLGAIAVNFMAVGIWNIYSSFVAGR